jgi:hypothetical protein
MNREYDLLKTRERREIILKDPQTSQIASTCLHLILYK